MLIRIIVADLRRAFLSWSFLFSALGIAFVLIISAGYRLVNGLKSVYEVYQAASGSTGSEVLTMILLPLLPYSLSFVADQNAHTTTYWSIRIGAAKYCVSRILVSAFSAWSTAFLGIWFFVALMTPFFSLSYINGSGGAYGVYLQHGLQAMFFLFQSAHLAFSALLFSVLAVLISAIIPNAFIALAAPAAFYIVALAVSQNINLPWAISLGVAMAGSYNAGTPFLSLTVKALNMLLRSILLGGGAYILMRRRIR